jgi:hypothetical protein
MSIFNNNLLAGAAAQSTTTPVHTIDQSIRFNSADKAFITQDSGGSFVKETTSTISMWVKRAGYIGSGTSNTVYGAFYGNNGRYDYINFSTSDQLIFGSRDTDATTSTGTNNPQRVTTQVFRDPSAWYHIVINLDTTNSVASERIRIYVNGARITDFATETTIPQNRGFYTMSDGVENNVGAFQDYTTYNQNLYFDGYLAEVALIDGTAYGPENFGEYNSSNIWIPKDISGLTFGSNGIYYKGQDASALGDDSSGNTNDGTVRNLASHDQVPDSPTNNFAVLSPIDKGSMTLSEGNLKGTSGSSSVWQTSKATMGVKSGKWYWEVRAGGTTYNLHGTVGLAQTLNTTSSIHPGVPSDGYGWYGTNGAIYHNGSQIATESTYTTGDIISFALDLDDSGGILTAYKNGVSEGNLTTTYKTADTDDFIFPAVGLLVSDTCIINFGQDGTFAGNVTAGGNSDGNGIGNFKYSVPSGFLALCTKNLGS